MSEFPTVTFTNYAGLVECFAQIKEHRNLSNQFCELMFGLASGHLNMIFTHKKRIGPLTLDALCELFAVQFVMQPNPEAEIRMKSRWEGRNKMQVRIHAKLLSMAEIDAAKRQLAVTNGSRGGTARSQNLPAERRTQLARKAAKARWHRDSDPSMVGSR